MFDKSTDDNNNQIFFLPVRDVHFGKIPLSDNWKAFKRFIIRNLSPSPIDIHLHSDIPEITFQDGNEAEKAEFDRSMHHEV